MGPTMKDIARAAGVSEGTVSNAINRRRGIGAPTAQRVLRIAQEMGYAGKQLDAEQPRYIRYIVYKKYGNKLLLPPFFSAIISEIEAVCRENGYELLITGIIQSNEDPMSVLGNMDLRQTAGIIVQATEMDAEDMQVFACLDRPVIVLDNYFQGLPYDYVLINNTRGGQVAAGHALSAGHRSIGILRSTLMLANFAQRHDGMRKALEDAGVALQERNCPALPPSLDGAYDEMLRWLRQSGPDSLPTCFLAYNDVLAVGAIRALLKCGVPVPERVSVIGFDDSSFCEISSPRLTTVKVYNRQMGSHAISRLLSQIGEGSDAHVKIEVDVGFVKRDSVTPYK